MKKLILIMAALACSFASSRAETLNSDNLANGFTAADTTTALTTGRLRIGVFRTLTDIQVTGAANNLQALNDDFIPLVDVAQAFNAPANGFFTRTSSFSGGSTVYSTAGSTATTVYDATPGVDNAANTTDLAGRSIYVWVLNDDNLATATQHGIYKTLQVLPDSDVVPPTELAVSLEDATALVGTAAGANLGGPDASFSLATITGAVLASEIQVLRSGVEIQSGGSVAYNGVLNFVIRNVGTGDLDIASVVSGGANAANFVVSAITPPVTVAPEAGNNTTAFTVTWTGSGTQSGTITIDNNDPDGSEDPFVFTINAGDVIPPATAPVVTTPTANQVFTLANLGDTVTVTGTATDNFAVTNVEVSLNNAPFENDAVLTAPGTVSTGFSKVITPNAGINTIRVRTKDVGGLYSPITTRTFTVNRPLDVIIAGSGTVKEAATFLPSPKNFQVGKTLTITAVPADGHIFTGWTIGGGLTPQEIGVTPGALEKAALTFTFRAGLTLTANFQANPFFALAGIYNGLVEETFRNFDISANSTHGFFNATVTSTGAFTGKLTIDGFVLNVNGAFDHNGDARFGTTRQTTINVARTNKPSLKVSLEASLTAPFTIQGTVTQTAFQRSNIVAESFVDADRAFYGSQVLTGTINPGSPAVALASTSGLTAGSLVTATAGIPANSVVPIVSATSSGSPDVAIPAINVGTRIVGEKVTGAGIPANTTILAISGTFNSGPISAGITNTLATVTLGSTAGRIPGEAVTGTGIQADTTILTVDSPTQITLTKPATATNAVASLTFVASKVTLSANATATATPTLTFTSPTRVLAVNGGFEVLLSVDATVAAATSVKLTFIRDLPAQYLTTATTGVHNLILPSRQAYYEVSGDFVDLGAGLDYFEPGAANDFQEDDVVVFDGTTLPTGITAGTEYFVVNKVDHDGDLDADEFQVSATQGGAPVDFTGTGSSVVAALDPDQRQIFGLETGDYPQGFGSGTLTLTKTGTVTLAGTLADGTIVSGSSTISDANETALHSSIYASKGFFSTVAKLNSADADSDISALTPAKWMRPAGAAAPTVHYYPAGWVEPIKVDLFAARYFGTGSVVKREDDGATTDANALADELILPDTANGNAELVFNEGQIEAGQSIVKTVSISTTNVVTKVPDPATTTFSLTLAPTTGLLSGDFLHTDDTKAAYKGIVYQKGSWAGGWGYFLTKQVVLDYTGESGFMGLFGIAP